ncbi:hypothetical protein [Archangium violaceum]|uniref:hypothetical protein n=1 Tax=Archangium violaceum TaxID=83451 RepID=UPI0037C0A8CD
MKRLLLSTAAAALLLSPLACDQLLAEKMMVGTVLSTPDVDVSLSAMAGFDAGTLPDGGFYEEDRLTLPGQTAAYVFFGTRNGDQGTPEPISNATVRIETQNGNTLNLENKGPGTYGLMSSSGEDAGVKYQSGTTYRFIAVQDGDSHVGSVEDAPAQERIDTLHPPAGFVRHLANQELTLRRPAVAGGKERTIGFVTVIPLSSDGDKGEPTYSNMPTDPLGFLQLAALPADWKRDTLTIPGSAFPQPQSNYLVVFQTVRSGGAESNNLFIGSALLVGTADVGMVRTQ